MYEVKDGKPFETEEEDFDTVMATDITFSGNIRFAKPFMIKGKVVGSVQSESDLLIDTMAEVYADIETDRVLVRGKVEGNIFAKTLVHVASTGSVVGDISSAQVILEPGSQFTGKCSMLSK